MSSLHLSAPLSLIFCSTIKIHCDSQCKTALNSGVWPTNGWDCDINISCEDSNTIQLCCKFILKVGFEKIIEFQYIFRDLRACFQPFLLIYILPFLFLPAAETNPKQHITMTNNKKSRILRHFMIFISF